MNDMAEVKIKDTRARGSLIGGFVGAVCGFLIGGAPDIIYHFVPNLPIHGASLYPWPIGLLITGLPASLLCILPGVAIGYLAAVGLRLAQSLRNPMILPQAEANAEVWPPAPKMPPL